MISIFGIDIALSVNMTRSKWLVLTCIAVLCGSALVRLWESRVQKLVVTLYDVGQGDAIEIRFPDNKLMLVDSPGGRTKRNTGEFVVLPEILRKARSLDFALMTHPDTDHAAGLLPIFQKINVNTFYYNPAFLSQTITRQLIDSVKARGGTPIQIDKTLEFKSGGAVVKLVPMGRRCQKKCSDNDQGVITWIEYLGCKVLLTADIESAGENEWIRSHNSRVDLLKVAHHGSKTSSSEAFLRSVKPVLAVASVGWKNQYHHPHPSVLKRFIGMGIPILRTDTEGFIELTVKNEGTMNCRSSRGSCGNYFCSGISRNNRFNEFNRSRSSAAFSN